MTGSASQVGASDSKLSDTALFATYGKSPSCKSCHPADFQLWQSSHHALAERPVDLAHDLSAFDPPSRIRHGSDLSRAQFTNGQFQIVTTGRDGKVSTFAAARAIGVAPLRQYLIPDDGGRLQLTELAFDPLHPDWFDVYGEEDRRPGEWGHWTGRGMTWNAMCAACHNTRVLKNYRAPRDTYATSMAEMGVGCEACHGPLAGHNVWQAAHPHQTNDPTLHRVTREEMFSVCGSCHARRAELTADFRPGDDFFDHYSLTIADETDTFYPDGQIRDEDYEFTSFLGSKMHDAGVRCIDCHEPHSLKSKLPGNSACLACHALPVPPAPKIDPATHSHHVAGGRGDACVDCHMPQTVYMQRHARHDHGFTIPDPLLTRQWGIPNACSRCHSDRDADWAVAAVDKWYGAKMQRPTRERAQVIARARAGEPETAPNLVRLLRAETHPLWRAVLATLLGRWVNETNVTATLLAGAGDPSPLVRARSVRALEPLAQATESPVPQALEARLKDPVREVRIAAAWALRASVDTQSTAGLDLLAYLHQNADEPTGELQLGVYRLDRGDAPGALGSFQRAVQWDANSAPLREALAVGLSLAGERDAAVAELRTACRLAPGDAEAQFKLGLALSEAGHPDDARTALEEAVKLDPQFATAWYNLGLACNAAGQTEAALEDLIRAESLDPASPQIPYARATILAHLGRTDEARRAARRALEIQPGYAEAAELLQALKP